MTAPSFVIAALVLPALIGCAVPSNIDRSVFRPEERVPEDRKFTLAVLPFEKIERQYDPEDPIGRERIENKEMEKFERIFFPARLVQTLKDSPWVSEAYVSPIMTPSVDFLVSGGIIESDGEVTEISITLQRCCWDDVFTQTFSIDLESADFKTVQDPGGLLWNAPVNGIGRYLNALPSKDRSGVQAARVSAYMDKIVQTSDLSERSLRIAGRAAQWERQNLLAHISTITVGLADKVKPTYVRWQKRVTELMEKKRVHDARAAMSFLMGLSSLGASAGRSVRGGIGVLSAVASVVSFAEVIRQSAQSSAILESVEKMTTVFATNLEPRTVQLENRVYTLTGTVDAQIAEMKRIVRRTIAGELER